MLWSVSWGSTVVDSLEKVFRVITRSSILPLLWVGSVMCCVKFKSSLSKLVKMCEVGLILKSPSSIKLSSSCISVSISFSVGRWSVYLGGLGVGRGSVYLVKYYYLSSLDIFVFWSVFSIV